VVDNGCVGQRCKEGSMNQTSQNVYNGWDRVVGLLRQGCTTAGTGCMEENDLLFLF
jgi:hypothetical protein